MLPDRLSQIALALKHPGPVSSDYDLNPDVIPVEHGVKSEAAVLFAMMDGAGEPKVILTKRAQHLRHHPGQIAFPGGKIEQCDSSPEAAALREAEEEIGLPSTNVEILGQLPEHRTVTGFAVRPVLGYVREFFEPRLDANEVEELILVPLDHLLDPKRYAVQGRMFRGAIRYYYTIPFGPHYVWGATARMTMALAERVST